MTAPVITHRPELSEPQDPWLGAADTQVNHNLRSLPYISPEQEAVQFQGIVENFALTDQQNTVISHPAPDSKTGVTPIDAKPTHTPRHRWSPERDYTPKPPEELERRRRANLQASFALAHTLRDSSPELMRGLVEATTEPVTEAMTERPANYRGTRRRLGRLARLFGSR